MDKIILLIGIYYVVSLAITYWWMSRRKGIDEKLNIKRILIKSYAFFPHLLYYQFHLLLYKFLKKWEKRFCK